MGSVRLWTDVVREKCEIREALIRPYLHSPPESNAIIDSILEKDNVEDLVHGFANGKVQVRKIIEVFCSRLARAHQMVVDPCHAR